MTELRKRMIECLQLRGFSERAREAYVRAVRQLAQHYNKRPDLPTQEELRQYFLYIKNVKKCARPTIALCGMKFFFEQTLGKQWTSFDLIRPPRGKKLPTILSVGSLQKTNLASSHPVCARRSQCRHAHLPGGRGSDRAP